MDMHLQGLLELSCRAVQALFHAREYPVGEVQVDEPRDLGAAPPLKAPRHRLAGPPQTWLTGDWHGTATSLTFHPGNTANAATEHGIVSATDTLVDAAKNGSLPCVL